MKLLFKFILIFITIGLEISAANDAIVAVVGHTPITKYDLESRAKFLHFMSGNVPLNQSDSVRLKNAALRSIIDDELFIQEAAKFKVTISKEDINNAAATIEHNNKLPKGSFIANLKSSGINIDTFTNQVKSQLIKQRLIYGRFAKQGEVTQSEVNQAASAADRKLEFKMKKIVTNSSAAIPKLKNLKSKISDCNIEPKLYNDFAYIEDVVILDHNMNSTDKFAIEKLSGQITTDPIHYNNQDYILVVCSRKIAGITDNEYDYISNMLGNKKLATAGQKYHNKLMKTTYIKIF